MEVENLEEINKVRQFFGEFPVLFRVGSSVLLPIYNVIYPNPETRKYYPNLSADYILERAFSLQYTNNDLRYLYNMYGKDAKYVNDILLAFENNKMSYIGMYYPQLNTIDSIIYNLQSSNLLRTSSISKYVDHGGDIMEANKYITVANLLLNSSYPTNIFIKNMEYILEADPFLYEGYEMKTDTIINLDDYDNSQRTSILIGYLINFVLQDLRIGDMNSFISTLLNNYLGEKTRRDIFIPFIMNLSNRELILQYVGTREDDLVYVFGLDPIKCYITLKILYENVRAINVFNARLLIMIEELKPTPIIVLSVLLSNPNFTSSNIMKYLSSKNYN
ncbi:Hypothetical protein ORPV_903 [Orpheovirus IHUMI-LCC2]|uniref:Uncharacterized protein n=1 Tax=Orpheovirus IHUMI-LCC2 TaxID=2023057 RepID=A0A2I2L5K5_9VIRU|nr:Hypothetical protein ORPV_903 [Orpheovirus IHUMI-LCC2]SNW62807.1 Hypothetical protein ORPV_903 [Orpheovirus IHUMI-LCC2]